MFFRWACIFLFFLTWMVPLSVFAQTEPQRVEAVITQINRFEKQANNAFDYDFIAQDAQGTRYEVQTHESYENGLWFTLKEGNRVVLQVVDTPQEQHVYFDDVIRTSALWVSLVLFFLVTLAVGWLRGAFSILGFFVTAGILFGFLFPQLLAGQNPILVTTLASIVILGVNIHVAHGFHKRTFFAFLGTTLGVIFTAIFAYLFTHAAQLSGLGTEEATLLLWDVKTIQDPVQLYLAAIILGAVGVLDDIAVAQSEIVEELAQANPTYSRTELFKRAMRIGRHHIASTVNTLILVYASAAMPTFLLAMHYSVGMDTFMNTQSVAEEIVRVVAGTSALVLTVPIATAFATIPKRHT